MNEELRKSAQKVQAVLDSFGLALTVVEFQESTRTSQEAADAIGCELGQIAKSLIFRGKTSHSPVCVIASGVNRVDEKKLKALLGEKVEKADADFVLQHTGYAIGGIPPVGHATPLRILVDEDLVRYETVWSAAGTPHAVFRLTSKELVMITRGEVVDMKQ
jgi:Cys-tRNA(Pro) deacylase